MSGVCPICSKSVPQERLEVHVDRCLNGQTDDVLDIDVDVDADARLAQQVCFWCLVIGFLQSSYILQLCFTCIVLRPCFACCFFSLALSRAFCSFKRK